MRVQWVEAESECRESRRKLAFSRGLTRTALLLLCFKFVRRIEASFTWVHGSAGAHSNLQFKEASILNISEDECRVAFRTNSFPTFDMAFLHFYSKGMYKRLL